MLGHLRPFQILPRQPEDRMFNKIRTLFFIGGITAAIVRTIMGYSDVWRHILGSTFDMAKVV